MTSDQLQLGPEALDRLFPLGFFVDASGVIRRCGPSLGRIVPDLLGTDFMAAFQPVSPSRFALTQKALWRRRGPRLVTLRHRTIDLALRGQVEFVSDGVLFLMSPWSSGAGEHKALMLSDFAWHDGGADAAIVAHTQQMAIQQAQAAIEELQAQGTKLVEARNAAEDARLEAEEASDAKARFLAMMSHEIRTPLNGVLGVVSLLGDTPLDEKQRGLWQVLSDSGGLLMSVINGVLEYSRIAAGRLELSRRPTDVRRLIQSLVALHGRSASTVQDRFELDVPDHPVWVLVDDNRLKQALGNLLSNAIKFGGGSVINVALNDEGEDIVVTVTDRGIGMSSEQVERLFQPFEQAAGGETARRYGGTGLGLAIVAGIVDAMAGNVSVESTPGQGSTFRVAIPVDRCEPMREVGPRDIGDLRGHHLLVVDDNSTNRLVASKQLERLGATVRTASSGLEAIAVIESDAAIELVFLDLDMPEMDGYETTRRLRASGCQLPIVAMSAHALPEYEQRARDCGMDDYVTKPAKRRTLLEYAARLLEH